MPRQDPDKRRQAIAHALWQVAVTDGLSSVSIRRVAQSAGVSTGQVQHYFPSRDDLLIFAAQQMVHHAQTQYPPVRPTQNRAEPNPGPIDSTGALDQAADALLIAVAHVLLGGSTGRGIALWYSFLAEAVANPRIAEVLKEAKDGQEAHVTALLTAWPTGPIPEPQRCARELIALADGLALRVHLASLTTSDALELVNHGIGAISAPTGQRPTAV